MRRQSLRWSLLPLCLLMPVCSFAVTTLTGKAVPVAKITPLIDLAKAQYSVCHAAAIPTVDGNDREWQGMPPITLSQKSQSDGTWNGPRDLSGSLRMAWAAKGMYFCLTVTDDCLATPRPNCAWLGNDCLLFSFDPFMHEWSGYEGGMSPNYCLNLAQGHTRLFSYRTRGSLPEYYEGVPEVQIAVGRKPGGERVYEWLIPWRIIKPVSPWIFGRSGFSFALNDCDEAGYQCGLAWTPGVLGLRNSANFGQLSFEGASGSRSDAFSVPTEPATTDKVGESRWLNISDVQPCQTARVLVHSAHEGMVQVTIRAVRSDRKGAAVTGILNRTMKAGETAAFVWDLRPLGEGNFTLTFDIAGIGQVTVQPQEYRCWDIEKLGRRLRELRERYGVDRPWDDLAGAPALIRKHRGMVAAALQWLEPASSLTGSARTSALYDAAEMVSDLDAGIDYLAKQKSESWSAYYSFADGSGQQFVIGFPKGYNPRDSYPLLVNLHGSGGRPQPTRGWVSGEQRIEVQPWGRGDTGYGALGQNDVLSIIAYMRKWYNVDPNRIFLTGESMGGGGTWKIATRRPDLFAAAAPLFGYGDGLPLENLRNVPVMNQHGLKDPVVPVDFDRVNVTRLQQLGYPVLHAEYPEAGHGIRDRFPLWEWMTTLSRQDRPAAITYSCETPDEGSAYWLRIRRFVDPHQPAKVQTRVSEHGSGQFVDLQADNVAVLELDTRRMPVNAKCSMLVQVGTSLLTQPAPLPERLYLLRQDGRWSLAPRWNAPTTATRPYTSGAAANLFTGEPLLIVYGTQGEAERTELYRKTAEKLATFAGSRGMALGRFPVKADRDVCSDDHSHYNLVLIGNSADNRCVTQIMKLLPFSVSEKNEMTAGAREPVSLDGAGLRLFYYNPMAPRRLVFLISTTAPTADAAKWLDDPSSLLSGSNGWNRCDQADLIVQSIGGPERRRMQFTDDWRWRAVEGADRRIPAGRIGSKFLTEASLRVMRGHANTDFALGWGEPTDKKLYDDRCFTLADMAIERTPGEVVITRLSGADLREIAEVCGKNGELAAFPALNAAQLEDRRIYTVAMPPSLSWLLMQRGSNLDSLQMGPSLRQEDLQAAVFAP